MSVDAQTQKRIQDLEKLLERRLALSVKQGHRENLWCMGSLTVCAFWVVCWLVGFVNGAPMRDHGWYAFNACAIACLYVSCRRACATALLDANRAQRDLIEFRNDFKEEFKNVG